MVILHELDVIISNPGNYVYDSHVIVNIMMQLMVKSGDNNKILSYAMCWWY